MSKQENSYSNWRRQASYISTMISISMVLFVIGLMGYTLMKGKLISDKSKENFVYEIYLKEGSKDIDIKQLKKLLSAEDYVIDIEYIDKEKALKKFKEEVDPNENFTLLLDDNPLPEGIDVRFQATYTHPDSVDKFSKKIMGYPIVDDVKYPSNLLFVVHQNLKRIATVLLCVAGLLLIVAIALINNTIRLRVYSQRFLIKTMQLIGAKHGFIRRPFLQSALLLGFLSGLLAVIALLGCINLLYKLYPDGVSALQNPQQDVIVYAGIVILGVLITWFSTLFSVSRFINMKSDKLYY